jgi:hypothetical protein
MTNNKDNLTKYAQDLERYRSMIIYAERNKDRAFLSDNFSKLDEIYDELVKIAPQNIDVSDEDIYEKVNMILLAKENGIYDKAMQLRDRILSVKVDSIIEHNRKKDNLVSKLKNIEASREKKGNVVSQWLGD